MTRSMMSCTCCWLNMTGILLIGQQYIDLAESRGRAAVTDGVALSRFTLAVAGRAELLPVALSGDAVAGMPEIGSSRLICHARKHAPLLSPFDLPERIAAKLKIVALLVDRKTAVALNQNAVVDAGNQMVGRHPRRTRREPYIGHALERNARPRIGVAAAARFRLPYQVGLIANRLIMLEHAFFDDRKFGSENAVVIVLNGREPAVVRAVAEDVDQFAAEREIPHFLRRKKAGPRVIRLIA